jgi:GDP-L-fucose synthase
MNIEQYKNKKILITGASGFVGKNLTKELKKQGFTCLLTPTSSEVDFTIENDVKHYFVSNKPEIVLHIAGLVGGIAANKAKPAEFFYKNAIMSVLINHYSYINGVKKLVSLAAGCGYPKEIPVPFAENDFWNGLPDMNSYGYSLAKKNLIIGGWAYREQYNFNTTVLLPANIYGPYDNFHLENSHVIPALIRKFIAAKESNSPTVEVWGTGIATREFLYVGDTVRAIIDAIDCNETGPFNLGTGVETSIKELNNIIAKLVGYEGDIIWNTNRPDGQPKRFYNMNKFKETFGYIPNTTLENGLRQTIDWYINNKQDVRL